MTFDEAAQWLADFKYLQPNTEPEKFNRWQAAVERVKLINRLTGTNLDAVKIVVAAVELIKEEDERSGSSTLR